MTNALPDPKQEDREREALPVVGYLRARKGVPVWDEDCVCENPVYPADPDGSDSDCESMPLVDARIAEAEISALRGRLQEAERDAARYRWMRDVGDATWRPFGLRDGCTAALADRAIDAAIRRATEAGKT